jgi:hypothetical protein
MYMYLSNSFVINKGLSFGDLKSSHLLLETNIYQCENYVEFCFKKFKEIYYILLTFLNVMIKYHCSKSIIYHVKEERI